MENFESIDHLDFDIPPDQAYDIDQLQFESFEDRRLWLVSAYVNRLCELEDRLGSVNLIDPEAYFDRLTQLEILMREDMENFGLERGELIQARVPNIIYTTDLKTVQVGLEEVVRARFEHLAIHPHYQIAADNQATEALAFGINLAISEPTVIGPKGIKVSEQLGETETVVSLHHPAVNLQRVILPY